MSPAAAEAFQLGTILAELRGDLTHVRQTGDRTHDVVTATQDQVGEIKLTLVRHDGRIQAVEEAMRAHPPHPTMAQFEGLEAEVRSGRLTWTKLIAGIAGVGGILIAGGALLLNWANALGAFAR